MERWILQVDAVVNEARKLAELFPDAREHIAVRHEETLRAWTDLLAKGEQRKDKLKQAEKLQAYFDDYRDLMYVSCCILSVSMSPTSTLTFTLTAVRVP